MTNIKNIEVKQLGSEDNSWAVVIDGATFIGKLTQSEASSFAKRIGDVVADAKRKPARLSMGEDWEGDWAEVVRAGFNDALPGIVAGFMKLDANDEAVVKRVMAVMKSLSAQTGVEHDITPDKIKAVIAANKDTELTEVAPGHPLGGMATIVPVKQDGDTVGFSVKSNFGNGDLSMAGDDMKQVTKAINSARPGSSPITIRTTDINNSHLTMHWVIGGEDGGTLVAITGISGSAIFVDLTSRQARDMAALIRSMI